MTIELEIKQAIDTINRDWNEYKKTNDELLKKGSPELREQLDKINDGMDAMMQKQADLEKELLASKVPETKFDNDLALEVKEFNGSLQTHYQSQGKSRPADFDQASYANYKSAFMKVAAGTKIDDLDSVERKALSAGSNPDGGYLLPESTAGKIVAKVYEMSSIRQLASVQTISTNDIEGLIDNDEADAGWVSELGTRSETDTPTLGKWRIEAHEMYAQPQVSQRLLDDSAVSVEAWLAAKIANKFARVESTAFMTGNGAGKPRGLFAYTTVATSDETRAWGEFEHVITGANGAFHTTKADPLQDLIGAFKNQYLANGKFLMRREALVALRKMKEATSDRYLWEPSLQAGQPSRLLGYDVFIDQYVPTIATGSLSLAFGDFKEAFQIIDRKGITTLRDPFTAKPYVRFYSTKRTGSGATNFEAVKFLKFSAA
jgi:HK97 family phage major capsid protein